MAPCRYCCDVHDFCYEKNGARAMVASVGSWTCDLQRLGVRCF
jgi:hypothetical protein